MDIKTLALYLGCNVKNNTSRNWQLIGITSTHEGVQCPLIKDRDQDYVCSVPFGSFKLLLRPLSSMMEEEAVNFYDELFPFVNDAMSGKQKHSIIRNELTVDALTGYREPSQFIQYVKWFPLLLSKGFDLFGLIEKGDALDATKVEKVKRDISKL